MSPVALNICAMAKNAMGEIPPEGKYIAQAQTGLTIRRGKCLLVRSDTPKRVIKKAKIVNRFERGCE